MLWSIHRLAAIRTGAVLLIVAVFVPRLVEADWAAVVRLVPSPPLVAMETMLLDDTPEVVRAELRGRMANTQLQGEDERRMIDLLVRDLRDDDRVDNAMPAIEMLVSCGETAIAALERALESPDYQQRQLAAYVLRRLPTHRTTENLLRVTFEGLMPDDFPLQREQPGRRGAYTSIHNAEEGTAYLACHAHEAKELLREGMSGSHPQPRLLCAVAAGMGGLVELIPQAVPILIERLEDNDVTGDAKMATMSLRGFGPELQPMLEGLRHLGDTQKQEMLKRLLRELAEDGRRAEYRERNPLSPLEQAMHDAQRAEWQRYWLPYGDWENLK